jgi:glycerophosphoryl diester phosphodiesterase
VPFDLQGHRGARGLAPENTVEGFAAALAIGVTTLELDVRLTRDGVPVVIHDSRPNPDFTRIDGAYVDDEAPMIGSLTLDEVRRFDVGRPRPGSRYARQFPDQVPHDGATIPTLAEVFSLARRSSVRFNVETKVDGESDMQAPDADVVVRAIIDTARRAGVLDRITIQSFDWRTLEAAARIAPGVELSCLTVERWWETPIPGGSAWYAGRPDGTDTASTPVLARQAGCDVWSPYYGNVTRGAVADAHAAGLRVVPWTVNSESVALRMLEAGTDGFITDYPKRMIHTLRSAYPSRL